jgi:ParB/RepB/Spo0J family partition protein
MEALQAQFLDIDRIKPDPNNPRKDYPKQSLGELAASFKAFGVQQPLKVRPKGKDYLVVFGHRRLKASELAELKQLPCFVEELDDITTAKLQLAENVAREDLSPLEVAGSLQRQLELGVTIEQLEKDTGWKRTTLYTHMQLMKLGPEGRKALGEELISKSVAMELATVPPSMQGEALAKLTKRFGNDRFFATVEEARHIIGESFRYELSGARFDKKDAQLCPKRGACVTCPKRTGANPDLFATSKSPDVCTDPECFEEKQAAWLKQQAALGAKVLSQSESKKTFSKYDREARPSYGSDYVAADEVSYEYGNKKPRSLVNKEDIVVGLHPNGQIVDLVPKSAIPKPKSQSRGGSPSSGYDKSHRAWMEKNRLDLLARSKVDDDLIELVSKKLGKDGLTAAHWKELALNEAKNNGVFVSDIAKKLGWDSGWKARELLKAGITIHQLIVLASLNGLSEVAELIGFDVDALRKKARAEFVAKEKAEKAAKKKPAAAEAKPAKKSGKKAA